MKLVVIPSEKLSDYTNKGLVNLKEYYNPNGYFDEVFLLSPLEKEERFEFGMKIIPIKNSKSYKKKLLEIKPNVVRAYGGYWASRFAIFNTSDIPVVVSLHDTHPWICYDSIKYTDHCICMTEAVRKLALKKSVNSERVTVLPNRVSLENFPPNSQLIDEFEYLNNTRYILHIGRKTYQKNLETVIASLVEIDKDIKLVCIGMGNKDRYVRLAKELNVLERCIWLDSVPNDRLSGFYSNSIAFVLPTRWEGFGVVFIEAASSGAPIITSDLAPMNEFLKDGENALLLKDCESVLETSEKIKMLINNSNLRSKIINNAIETSQLYSREKINSEEVGIYKNVIKTPQVRSRPTLLHKVIIYMKSLMTYTIYRIESKVRK